VKNPQWFCKNSCSFIFCLIFKKISGLYSPMLQLFRFGVSGYIPPSPESAEPTPWLQDRKLTFAFFLWWICSNKNIFFPLFNISTNSQYINWTFSEDFNFLMIIVYVLWVCKHDRWFFPGLASGVGGYIYSTSTNNTVYMHKHTPSHIYTHTLTNKYARHRSIYLSVYLFINLLIYLPCFNTFCSFLGLGVS